jgi:peptidoglycan/LPS O-acetylase OafA/YrhL
MSKSFSASTSHNRVPELDGLRAVSILLVICAHMLPLGPKFIDLNYSAGAMGMSLFFALSGFLISSTLLARPRVLDFLVRRLARILPLYFLYLIILFVFWDHSVSRLVSSMLFTINYQTQFLTDHSAHLWSLCVEIHFYISIAIGVALLGRRAVYLVWPACLIVTGLRINAGAEIDIHTHLRVDEILSGACVATLYANGVIRRTSSTPAVMALIAAALLWFVSSSEWSGLAINYVRPYATALMLALVIAAAPQALRAALSSRPARYVAEISYALYVIHPATIMGFMNDGSVAERYLIKRPMSFALTFALAHLSTFYWESMWRRAAASYLSRNRTLGKEDRIGSKPVLS